MRCDEKKLETYVGPVPTYYAAIHIWPLAFQLKLMHLLLLRSHSEC